jgi:hypothetical protein
MIVLAGQVGNTHPFSEECDRLIIAQLSRSAETRKKKQIIDARPHVVI